MKKLIVFAIILCSTITLTEAQQKPILKKIIIENNKLVTPIYINIDSIKCNSIKNKTQRIETKNYLYCYPPYPNPATTYVKSLVYWDTSLDFSYDDVSIYNINGEKVAGKENLEINKQNAYSGYLTWHCNSIETGVYLMQINHGDRSKIIKIIVQK